MLLVSFLVSRKMRFRTESAKKRIIQNTQKKNTPRMGPVFGHMENKDEPTGQSAHRKKG